MQTAVSRRSRKIANQNFPAWIGNLIYFVLRTAYLENENRSHATQYTLRKIQSNWGQCGREIVGNDIWSFKRYKFNNRSMKRSVDIPGPEVF